MMVNRRQILKELSLYICKENSLIWLLNIDWKNPEFVENGAKKLPRRRQGNTNDKLAKGQAKRFFYFDAITKADKGLATQSPETC